MAYDRKIFREDQEEIYMTLPELNISVSKFSNVTLGKDEVDYILVNTKNITKEGILFTSNRNLKHIGSKAGVLRYAIKKGDIIFPFRSRTHAIAVVTKTNRLPMVGHHGLMKISCGEENLDLAFFIKDFLQISGRFRFMKEENISIDFLNSIKFPIATKELNGYADAILSLIDIKKTIYLFELSLKSDNLNIFTNAIQEKHQANIAISNVNKKYLKEIKQIQQDYHDELNVIQSKYKNSSTIIS